VAALSLAIAPFALSGPAALLLQVPAVLLGLSRVSRQRAVGYVGYLLARAERNGQKTVPEVAYLAAMSFDPQVSRVRSMQPPPEQGDAAVGEVAVVRLAHVPGEGNGQGCMGDTIKRNQVSALLRGMPEARFLRAL
jgi:hypothetical protein